MADDLKDSWKDVSGLSGRVTHYGRYRIAAGRITVESQGLIREAPFDDKKSELIQAQDVLRDLVEIGPGTVT